jgi:hypothetical protein
MIDPLPNCFSIPLRVKEMAFSFSELELAGVDIIKVSSK